MIPFLLFLAHHLHRLPCWPGGRRWRRLVASGPDGGEVTASSRPRRHPHHSGPKSASQPALSPDTCRGRTHPHRHKDHRP